MYNEFDTVAQKLKCVMARTYKSGQYHKMVEAAAAFSHLAYLYNQFFVDEYIEEMVENVAKIKFPSTVVSTADSNVVLFYDAFGFDTRGLALIYLKGLARLDKKVVYVTTSEARGKQSLLMNEVEGYDFVTHYIPSDISYFDRASQILDLVQKHNPASAFMYIHPYDVDAVMAFERMENVKRFQINLTDHAYWLGVRAFDYCIEFRNYGYKISKEYRGIPVDKLVILPFYPYVNYDIPFEGFPFQCADKKIVFSGGALYKTFSQDNLYYEIVECILNKYEETIFLYAGNGDDSKLKILMQRFPDRVYHIAERRDLYQVMKHSFIYLNTYPLLGGLMTQYAAIAGILPVTLKHDRIAEGFLIDEDKTGVFFETKEQLLAEIDKVFQDEMYHSAKKELIRNTVIREDDFKLQLNRLVQNGTSGFEFTDLQEIEIEKNCAEYRDRFCKANIEDAIAKKRNKHLMQYFPHVFLSRFWKVFISSKS